MRPSLRTFENMKPIWNCRKKIPLDKLTRRELNRWIPLTPGRKETASMPYDDDWDDDLDEDEDWDDEDEWDTDEEDLDDLDDED